MRSKAKVKTLRSKGIGGTYIYIKDVPDGLSKEKVLIYLESNVKVWAESKYKSQLTVQINVEDGSIKVWIAIGAISLLQLVSEYGSIRTGVDYLVKDSRELSEYVITQLKAEDNIPDNAISRTEKRLGVPGKIQRYFKDIDKVNNLELSHNERQEKIEILKREFILILELLENEQDRNAFVEELPTFCLPSPNEPWPEPIHGAFTLQSFRDDREFVNN